jgi:hypothetical protein
MKEVADRLVHVTSTLDMGFFERRNLGGRKADINDQPPSATTVTTYKPGRRPSRVFEIGEASALVCVCAPALLCPPHMARPISGTPCFRNSMCPPETAGAHEAGGCDQWRISSQEINGSKGSAEQATINSPDSGADWEACSAVHIRHG